MKENRKRITFAERDAAKKAARKKSQTLIESGQLTPHEAQMHAAPYSELPVRIVDLQGAIARRYERKAAPEAAKQPREARKSDQAERGRAQALLTTYTAAEIAELETAMSELREHNLHRAPAPRWTSESREKVARFANARMILKVIGV